MLSKRTPAALATLAGFIAVAAGAGSAPSTAATATAIPVAPRAVAPSAGDPLRLVLAPTGNEARYRVREQLARVDFPNDAVGATSDVTGGIVIDTDGKIVREGSKFVVDLRRLASDRDRRDRYVQRRTLQTDQFPTVELVPTALRGLPSPLPTSGAASFELVGDLTIHGVTRPTTWQVKAQFDGGHITGTATTGFTFEDFGLTKPRVSIVLSVADSIHLEYDFNLVPSTAAGS